jgi:transcriptional regulator with XRE-family HTH domain
LELDYEQVASELLRALRGTRSQVQWSRWLGYRSNVAYAWESGRRWPKAAEFYRAARRAGVDVDSSVERYFGAAPDWAESTPIDTPEGVAALLEALRGRTTVQDLARRARLSRYSVTRWLQGQTQPRLPDFLRLVQAASVRMVDLVAGLVDPAKVASLAPLWRRLEARRKGAAIHPWTQAVLRALELGAYQRLRSHQEGWLASTLGFDLDTERACVAFLEETGQIAWTGTRYRLDPLAVDTKRHPAIGRQLKGHWTRVAAERLEDNAQGQFSYNVAAVSKRDFERIRELHLGYFRAMRAIVDESEPGQVVCVVNVQLFPLNPI